jgi:predicted lipid-binding transport protein (Tim44 family)/uncharacterized membrane protein YgcG
MAIPGTHLENVHMKIRGVFIFLCTLLAASLAWGRGGGGCLEEGTLIASPAGPMPIERLKPGDAVWAVVAGQLQSARVEATSQVEPDGYVEITAAGRTLRATAEHPVQIGPGTFRIAADLQPGDAICVREGDDFKTVPIEKIARVTAVHPAFNLLVMPGGTYLANGMVVHNKGCFLPDTPILRADGTSSPISEIRPGDELIAFTTRGEIVHTTVRRVIIHEVDEYVMVGAGQTLLRVTREHPFYVGDGTFKTLATLKIGDRIFTLGNDGLCEQRITRLETVRAPTRVYNLQTDHPNTYFANGVAVHNKGGGCFPAGTQVSTPHGLIPIEKLKPGDAVLAVDACGNRIKTAVENVQMTRSALLVIETDQGVLRTTSEHPLLSGGGDFCQAGACQPGGQVMTWGGNGLQPATIRRMTTPDGEEDVYNLRVGSPHTFIADGFVVHNKGGGGFGGGGFGGGGSGGGGSDNPIPILIFIGIFIVVILISKVAQNAKAANENLDYVNSRSDIERKAAKTQKLLEFLARVDPTMAPDKLETQAEATFVKLQQCWQARNYEPMQSLLMPDLYAEHCAQISGLIGNHEINLISNLKVEHVDLVNVRYPQKENDREFTALFTASARDYYVDDRTQEFLRGDEQPAQFQEFWTFHRQGGAWLLREIDQSRESDALKEENFFEQFTDVGLNQVYDKTAGQEGPAGPWLEKATLDKATRIERLLNFLVQTDKLWNCQAMLERARQVFLDVTLAREKGDPAGIPTAELFPDVAAGLQGELVRLGGQGTQLEFRNLCVRKAELILVRNFADNSQDEFTVRISAHAQRAVRRNNLLISQDTDVTPFVEFWTFGRLDHEWKLKEVLPPARGGEEVAAENVDEDATPEQLQWYYQQTRAN